MPKTTARPRWILFLLWPFKGEPCFPQIEGDLIEEYQHRLSINGIPSTRRWYCWEIVRNGLSLARRWVTIQALILPLFCLPLHLLLFQIYRNLLFVRTQSFSLIQLTLDLLFQSIVGLALGMTLSYLLGGHERMVRLSCALYYILLVISWNAGLARNVLLGVRINISDIPVMAEFCEKSFVFLWALICIWLGSAWIGKHRWLSDRKLLRN
jgi:hypothetical protein